MRQQLSRDVGRLAQVDQLQQLFGECHVLRPTTQPEQSKQTSMSLYGEYDIFEAGEAWHYAGQLKGAADAGPSAPTRRGSAQRPASEEDLPGRGQNLAADLKLLTNESR